MTTLAPCRHAKPRPDDCRWCGMAVRADRRYAHAFWPDQFPPAGRGSGPARAAARQPAGGCRGCLGQEQYYPDLLPGVADPVPEAELDLVPPGWAHRPAVREAHVAAFRKLLATDFPPPARAEGDGVVTVGGGPWWPMIVVAIRMLRDVSGLPVQVWYRGAAEPVDPRDLEGVPGVTYHDSTRADPAPRILRGWEAKTVALAHCGLRRVLYLDADAYCVGDPQPLLDLAGAHRFVYWSDMPNHDTSVKWDAYGLTGAGGVRPVQGGQLAFDRLTFWRELVLAHWLNQHSDWSYSFQFGDQDAYRIVLSASGAGYHCLGPAPHPGVSFVCPLNGRPVVNHRVNGKAFIGQPCPRANHLPGEDRFHAYWDVLRAGRELRRAAGRPLVVGERGGP